MPLERKFTKFTTASPVFATFPSEELASGLGFVKFYLTQTLNVAGETFLTSDLTEGAAFSQGAASQVLDTSAFNLPRFVKGSSCYFFFSFSTTVGGAGHTVSNIKVQKWDGTTATDITEAITTSATSGTKPTFLKLDITNETLISQGDTIRLIYTVNTPAGQNKVNGTVADPATLYVPFRNDN
ncbi:hypothetical protein KAR91_65710 [Candidatus Pacearchaeota archaeon]|nr:hypothetical protein [Candidatus Pacearchaeota archaeon]